jgi:hypothetical protein
MITEDDGRRLETRQSGHLESILTGHSRSAVCSAEWWLKWRLLLLRMSTSMVALETGSDYAKNI